MGRFGIRWIIGVIGAVGVVVGAACTPPSTPPPGTTTTTSSSTTTTVVDTTPPVLSLPADITVAATSAAGADVSWSATALDAVDGPVPVTCTPAAGLFAVGTTIVACSATDAASNSANGDFSVTVQPYVPPDRTVVAGAYHSCALNSDGTVWCWGDDMNGAQLGNGAAGSSPTPVSVSGLTDVTAIAAGSNHTCALISDGTVKCWGYNNVGQIGNGVISATPVDVPTPVTGLTNAIAIDAGDFHSCALISDGTVKCWGGNSATVRRQTPRPL